MFKRYLVEKTIVKSIRAGMHVLFGAAQINTVKVVVNGDKEYVLMSAIGDKVQHLYFKEMYQNYFEEGMIRELVERVLVYPE